jgi:hypothetical protein
LLDWTPIWIDTESDGFHGPLLSIALVTGSAKDRENVLDRVVLRPRHSLSPASYGWRNCSRTAPHDGGQLWARDAEHSRTRRQQSCHADGGARAQPAGGASQGTDVSDQHGTGDLSGDADGSEHPAGGAGPTERRTGHMMWLFGDWKPEADATHQQPPGDLHCRRLPGSSPGPKYRLGELCR